MRFACELTECNHSNLRARDWSDYPDSGYVCDSRKMCHADPEAAAALRLEPGLGGTGNLIKHVSCGVQPAGPQRHSIVCLPDIDPIRGIPDCSVADEQMPLAADGFEVLHGRPL